MLNVNQITAQLAKLPDQSLQRYAMMHKDDPYVLSLAVAESNRRKELRTGAQMNAPQSPKVADQAIQGMAAHLPEHVGIGQLPVGEMNFAGGGIVAFADGGDVPRYQTGGQMYEARNPFAFLNPGDIMSGIGRVFREGISPAAAEQRRIAEQAQALAQRNAAYQMGYDPAQYPMPEGTPTSLPTAPVAGTGQTPPTAPTGAPQLRAPGSATGQGFDSTPAGLMSAYNSILKQSQGQLTDPLAAQREEVSMADITAQQKAIDAFKREKEAQGEFGEAEEKRLKERGARIEGSEKQNLGLALLQAGSAMMAGKSRYALANIGAGVGVGAEQFAKGLDKIDTAKEKLDDAFSRLEQARRMEGRMDAAELRKLEGELAASFRREKERGLQGLEMALGINEKRATAIFDAYAKGKLAETEAAGRMGYAERAGNLGLFRALGDGDVKKGFEVYTASQAESKGLAGLVQNFAKNPTALAILKQSDPDLANLIQMQMRNMALQPTATPTGPVRP